MTKNNFVGLLLSSGCEVQLNMANYLFTTQSNHNIQIWVKNSILITSYYIPMLYIYIIYPDLYLSFYPCFPPAHLFTTALGSSLPGPSRQPRPKPRNHGQFEQPRYARKNGATSKHVWKMAYIWHINHKDGDFIIHRGKYEKKRS